MTMDQDRYIDSFSTIQDEALLWLERQTNLRTRCARMLCGHVEGLLLTQISSMIRPSAILEIGTFTGYSTICLTRGLAEGGVTDTLELNDELEDLILEGFSRAGLSDRINLHIGDARRILLSLDRQYDLVFIDANKREYSEYYSLVFDKVRKGGFIIADNVLWSGKILDTETSHDAQTLGVQAFNELVAGESAAGRVRNVILPVRDGMNVICKL